MTEHQRVVVSRVRPSCSPLARDHQDSVLSPFSFSNFINDQDEEMLRELADTLEGCAASQRDLDWLESWTGD